MLELMVMLAIGGSALAGLYDLKTTEVPEDIPYLMTALGVFYWFAYALTSGDFYPLLVSLSAGTLLLAVGLILYKRGQWGEADAWVLAAIAYTVPLYGNGIFMLDFLMNLFLAGAAYTIVYAVILGLLNRSVFPHFLRDMKGSARMLLVPSAFMAISFGMRAYGIDGGPLFTASVLFLLFLVFWRYSKTIEARVFRKRIAARNLRAGDVVEGMVWRGLTKHEVEGIRKKSRYVVVREGVRFVPVFPISLVLTLLSGNVLFSLLV